MKSLVAISRRLTLHPFTSDDTAFVLELVNTPGWHRFIGDRGIRDEAAAAIYITNSLQRSYEVNGFGLYRCDLKEGGQSVGMCGLVSREDLPAPDIGFAFLTNYEGQSLAYEASLAVLNHAAHDLNLATLLAITKHENERSVNLLLRLKFALSNIKYDDAVGIPLQVYQRDLTNSLK